MPSNCKGQKTALWEQCYEPGICQKDSAQEAMHLAKELILQESHTKMVQLADLFSVPEMGLICNVADYLRKKSHRLSSRNFIQGCKECHKKFPSCDASDGCSECPPNT
ncbi:hypothetical protein NQ317_005375 [Molorchus minor]|uniref:Uncharacterized protein n=1 Tax=Molorchus minor TaxID=1323400 RepID=A0ABQ9J5T7_9CUCU|nr:hypothetical protein NQ317_005375 [Molorchus minor]